MGWVKLDDGFFRNPKVVGISKDAKFLYVAALCYCGENMTDGRIPTAALRLLSAEIEVKNPARLAKELVSVGLWKASNDAEFHVHDYLAFNESSDERKAKQEQARERMKRNRSQNVRANNTRTSQGVRETFALQETDTDTDTEGDTEGDNPPAPIRGSGKRSTLEERFQAFWSAYPKKVAKDDARKRWQALKPSEELLDEILTALDWQRRKPDWLKDNGQFIPNPATWLNRGCWQDEPPAGVVTTAPPAPNDPVAKAKAEKARLEGFMASGNWHAATPYERQAYTVPPTGADNYARKIAGLNKIINGTEEVAA